MILIHVSTLIFNLTLPVHTQFNPVTAVVSSFHWTNLIFKTGSAGLEGCDSTASSPMIIHRPIPEDMSVKAFKKVLEGPTQREREDEEAKRKKLQVRKSS